MTESTNNDGSPPSSSKNRGRNPIRWLYDWVLSWANSRFGTIALAILAFAESSFFPVPPDILQIALSVERPKKSFFFAFVSALFSTLGALLGWIIGFALWQWLQPIFIPHIFSQEVFDLVQARFHEWGFLSVFTAAFTPIPFKVFTIAAGTMNLSLPILLLASLIGRSARFFLVATIMYFFGAKAKEFIDRWFGLLTILLLLLLVAGFVAIKYLM